MNNKDFQIALGSFINSIPNLGFKARAEYFKPDQDDLVINATPGGRINREYMDGMKEVQLPFEIAIKSKINQKAYDAIWLITEALSSPLINWPDNNNSYSFVRLNVNRPTINGRDEQGYYVYTLNLDAILEVQGEE